MQTLIHECSNCRERIRYFRLLRTPAWGRFRCPGCGSVLGISFARRLIGVGIWLVGLILITGVLHLHTLAAWITYPGMVVAMLAVLYLCDRVKLLERRAFTCRRCGYDLHGLSETRCPECGESFDPSERERILARALQPPPRPRYWPVVLLVALGLCVTTAMGIAAWRRSAAATPPVPVSPSAP